MSNSKYSSDGPQILTCGPGRATDLGSRARAGPGPQLTTLWRARALVDGPEPGPGLKFRPVQDSALYRLFYSGSTQRIVCYYLMGPDFKKFKQSGG